ncbi:MAG: response regulator [Nitrospirota bacterium]|nr:response regulator [Nitrospirota bacterium]
MSHPVPILLLEDDRGDVELLTGLFEADGFACRLTHVDNKGAFDAALREGGFDLIISDFTLPAFDGFSALTLAKTLQPRVPFIFFAGTLGDDTAVRALKAGATDYVLKTRPGRLVSAVRQALRHAEERTRRAHAEQSLKDSEAQLRSILESANDAIVTSDSRGVILLWNRAAERIFGYTQEEVFGKPLTILMPQRYRPAHQAGLERANRTGTGELIGKTIELHGVRKDGTEFPLELSLSRWQTGTDLFYSGLLRDITERKRMEEQLRQAQKMDALGRLAGGVAHDFNNLLTVITGSSHLVLRRLGDDHSLRQKLQRIQDAGERGAFLTRQLLAFSRQQVREPKVLDLNAMIAGMEELLRRLVGEDVSLITVLTPTPACVKADPGQIEQILMNLITNAKDALAGGGRITIETKVIERERLARVGETMGAEGPYVALDVSDTGCGMDAATKARIFEPFFTTKERGKGTGLGLAMVYGIVQQSGGSIAVSSEPGRGSTCTIYLPQADGQPVAPPMPLPAAPIKGSETILLVEDEPAVRLLARETLEEAGFHVLEARQGEEALALAKRHRGRIHLLLTDVVMPELSGRELADQLMGLDPEMRVLFMSGYAASRVGREGVLQVGTAFLAKPFTPDALLRKVREALDQPPGQAIKKDRRKKRR